MGLAYTSHNNKFIKYICSGVCEVNAYTFNENNSKIVTMVNLLYNFTNNKSMKPFSLWRGSHNSAAYCRFELVQLFVLLFQFSLLSVQMKTNKISAKLTCESIDKYYVWCLNQIDRFL